MNTRLAKVLVNGLLCGAALVALLPLLWMLSVSFMAPGEASSLPPPLLPAHATLANYRELFAHAGMGRYLLNSLLVSSAITALSLACNLMAGSVVTVMPVLLLFLSLQRYYLEGLLLGSVKG